MGLGRRGQRRVEYRGRLGKGISGSVSVSATASRERVAAWVRNKAQNRAGWCNGGYKDAISEWCLCWFLLGECDDCRL